MNRIDWTDDLLIGIGLLDSQHKTWVEFYNKTADAINAAQMPGQIASTLGFLAKYTEEHFSTEETVMEQNRYPDRQAHAAKHDVIRRALTYITNEFKADCLTDKLGASIEKLLGVWLIQHIQSADIRFAAFMRKH